jgi:hypothetical protein
MGQPTRAGVGRGRAGSALTGEWRVTLDVRARKVLVDEGRRDGGAD